MAEHTCSDYSQQFYRNNPIYPQDEITVIRPTHKFRGQVTQISQEEIKGKVATHCRIIDDAILVRSVDEKVRQSALDYFSSAQERASSGKEAHRSERNWGIAKAVIGATTGIGAGVGLAASLIAPPLAIPGMIASLAVSAWGTHQTIENQKAMDHLQQDLSTLRAHKEFWHDPIQNIQKERQAAGELGFSYSFAKRLKNTILHPEEVSALWVRDFGDMLSNPSIESFSKHLLGKEQLAYAWKEGKIPDLEIGTQHLSSDTLQKMALQYQECSQHFERFKSHIQNEMRALGNQADQIAQDIETQRRRWLLPAHHLYDAGVREAKFYYHQALGPFLSERDLAIAEAERTYHYRIYDPMCPDERRYKLQLDDLRNQAIAQIHRAYACHPTVLSIERAYRKDLQMCGFLFEQSKQVANSFFDEKVRQNESEANKARLMIEEQRARGEQFYSHALKQIMEGTKTRDLHKTLLSAPVIERKWQLSPQIMEPSWHEVYGRAPRFQTSFADTIQEGIWNLFWGDSCLGVFSRSPSSRWNSWTYDRTRSPFQARWFYQSAVPSRPEPRMFCQRVVVPPAPARRPVSTQRAPEPRRKEPNGVGVRPSPTENAMGRTERRPQPVVERRDQENRPPRNPNGIAVVAPGSGFGGTQRR